LIQQSKAIVRPNKNLSFIERFFDLGAKYLTTELITANLNSCVRKKEPFKLKTGGNNVKETHQKNKQWKPRQKIGQDQSEKVRLQENRSHRDSWSNSATDNRGISPSRVQWMKN